MNVKFIDIESAEYISDWAFSNANVLSKIQINNKNKFYLFLLNYITQEEGNQLLDAAKNNKVNRFIYLLLKFGFELFEKDGGTLKISKEKREIYTKWILFDDEVIDELHENEMISEFQ